MTTDTNKLGAALLAAQIEIRGFYKDAENTFHGFNYASSDAVVAQGREVLHRHGLSAFVVAGPKIEMIQGEPLRATISVRFRVEHSESGQAVEVERMAFAEPGKGRPLDKAIVGAETMALRDFLRGLLFVPRMDEDPNLRNDVAYDPECLGAWSEAWLRPECVRLGLSVDQLRAAMVRKGKAPEKVQSPVHNWPIAWKAEIKDGLAKFAQSKGTDLSAEKNGPDLEQREVPPMPDVKTVAKPEPAPDEAKPKTNGKAKKGEPVAISQSDIPF